MTRPPRGIYAVAVVFFCAGLVCIAVLLPPVFYVFGWKRELDLLSQPGLRWVLAGGWLGLTLVCYGVFLLVRLHAAPQWALFGITLLFASQVFSDATGSPFYSPQRLYLNRALMIAPLVASCAYLVRPSFRAVCREFRASPSPSQK